MDRVESTTGQLPRRKLLQLGMIAAPEAMAGPKPNKALPFLIGEGKAVVETSAGKVRGFSENGIYTYLGVPYGASTEGALRFQPPVKPKPWASVRDALQPGPVSPQWPFSRFQDVSAYFFEYQFGTMSEDCLRLNVWTPSINDNAKRPVLFWLHEGGFYRGSSLELKSCNGRNLAQSGDVVVISINHRLNALGFLNLAEYGERFASAANNGMLDIVLALEWVRDNVARFGGDPANVTIFGQSGGGSKVNHLMVMPSAQGLFHKAIVQSANPMITDVYNAEQAAKYASEVVGVLGLNRSSIERIAMMPHEQIAQASLKVSVADSKRQYTISPVADGRWIPSPPFSMKAPDLARRIPLVVGTTDRESGPVLGPGSYRLTTEELRKRLSEMYTGKASEVLQVFEKTYPGDKPYDLWTRINNFNFRKAALRQATLKSAQGAAPAYVYLFGWKTTAFEGLPQAFHGSELPFVFRNTDLCARMTGGTEQARRLAARISGSWVQFARSGNPNHKGMPHWPAFDPAKEQTMFFDNLCASREHFDREARLVLESAKSGS